MTRIAPLVVLALAACPKGSDNKKPVDPIPHGSDGTGSDAGRLLPEDDAGMAVLPPAPPVPKPPAGLPSLPDSPALAVVTPDTVALGELLFHDARLGSDGKTSCATCHDPAHGYAGKDDTTAAGKPNLRRTPALVNLAWTKDFGWDGRYHSLDEHLAAHVRGQLGDDLEPALRRVADLPLYKAHLARVGGAPTDAALHALEAFVLTRYDGDSPWDRLEPTMRMPKPGAPGDPIVAGYVVFTSKGQCAVCHTPPLYTDSGYHKTFVGAFADEGRGKVDPAQAGAFRTPTLRGAANRVAFFHSGAKTTLDEVVDYYLADHAGLDPALKKVALSPAERTSLLAFLRALSAPAVTTKPVLP